MFIRGIKGRKRNAGFTLVELMIVVAIIGILAAVAIPAFTRYVRKSRTAEAMGHLNKMWAGSLTYYESDHFKAGAALPKQFPANGTAATAPNSGGKCCAATGGRCPGNDAIWDTDAAWKALSFSIPDPYNYMPSYVSAGTGKDATFTAKATGDLDCDGVDAVFTRAGRVSATTGDVTGSSQPEIDNELE